MDGIISKGNYGLFQNEIELQGKYASEIRFLRDEVKIFNSFRDAYVVSAIIGFITNSNIDVNEVDNVQAASIFPEEIGKDNILDYKGKKLRNDSYSTDSLYLVLKSLFTNSLNINWYFLYFIIMPGIYNLLTFSNQIDT